MEREIMLTGIGGQSIQLAAQILAGAAVIEGREVMLLGSYGGTMRGGNTDSTILVADEPIVSPPIVASTWSALVMHHQFWQPLRAKLRVDSVVVVNSSLFRGEVDRGKLRWFDVPATEIAAGVGSALGASLVLVGAYASLTGILGIASLLTAMRNSIPAYRQQHVETNERALRAGFEAVGPGQAPAWTASNGELA